MGDAALGVLDTRMTLLNGITIPTRIPSYEFRASGEAATMVQDAVEKQVFADCTDRGTTAAVGGKLSFIPPPFVGGGVPHPDLRCRRASDSKDH
jgi:hypothetical protein